MEVILLFKEGGKLARGYEIHRLGHLEKEGSSAQRLAAHLAGGATLHL